MNKEQEKRAEARSRERSRVKEHEQNAGVRRRNKIQE